MIFKPLTVIAFLLFVASGAYMFGVKYQSQNLLRATSQALSATQHDEEDIRVLQAQWALEASPPRVAELAAQFTQLQPMKPTQMVTTGALAGLLPAPGSAAPGANPLDDAPALPVEVAQAATPVPAAPTQAVAQVMPVSPAATPRHQAPLRLAGVESLLHNLPTTPRAPHHHHAPAPVELASADYGSSIFTPTAEPVEAPHPVQAAAPATQDNGGSLLGMASGGAN